MTNIAWWINQTDYSYVAFSRLDVYGKGVVIPQNSVSSDSVTETRPGVELLHSEVNNGRRTCILHFI